MPSAYPAPPGYPPGYAPPPGYLAQPGYQAPPAQPQRRSSGTLLVLGSMTIGAITTGIVAGNVHSGTAVFMVLLIWAAIVVLNVVNARHR